MKIYRFVPETLRYSRASWGYGTRWWPNGIELRTYDAFLYNKYEGGGRQPTDNRYPRFPEELEPSDFPMMSLQVPVVSVRAAEKLGFHPERAGEWPELASRLHPMWIGARPFYAVQPLFSVRGEPHAFVPEASRGIALPNGEIVHYHTRMFEPARLPGEFFTIPPHEPYADVYVTERFVDRARDAGLTGLADLELVFDGAPVPPRHTPPPVAALDRHWFRRDLEWDLFRGRGSMGHYPDAALKDAFRRAVLDGLLTLGPPPAA